MKLLGFSCIHRLPIGTSVWIKVTEKALEAVLKNLEAGEPLLDTYLAELMSTETFERKYAVLDKPEHFRRAVLDTIDGDTLLEGWELLLLDYDSVVKLLNPPEEKPVEETPEETPESEGTPVEETDDELTCAHCGKKFTAGYGTYEWFGMNYCSDSCMTAHEFSEDA